MTSAKVLGDEFLDGGMTQRCSQGQEEVQNDRIVCSVDGENEL